MLDLFTYHANTPAAFLCMLFCIPAGNHHIPSLYIYSMGLGFGFAVSAQTSVLFNKPREGALLGMVCSVLFAAGPATRAISGTTRYMPITVSNMIGVTYFGLNARQYFVAVANEDTWE
eukprot:PhF_6_TR19429/c0_g1_i1/m.28417